MVHKRMAVPLPPSREHGPRAWWVPGAASAAGDASTGGLFLGGHIPGMQRVDGKNNKHGCSLREPASRPALRGCVGEPKAPETEEIK